MKSSFALNSNALCIEMDSKWELCLTTSFSLGIIDSLHPLVVYSSCVFSSPTPHEGEGNDHILPSGYVWMTLTLTSPTLLSSLSVSDPDTSAKAAPSSELFTCSPFHLGHSVLGALTFGSLNIHGLAKMAFQCEFQNLS